MSDTDPETASENWTEMMEGMNDAISRSIEQNMQAQSAFIESWSSAFDGTAMDGEAMDMSGELPDSAAMDVDAEAMESMLTEGVEGYGRAYEVWMDAAERMAERVSDAAQGEDVSITEFRDIWLQSANEAFSEVMNTTAFAAGTGQTVSQMMELQQQADDLTQDALEGLGFATGEDIEEVGARLVELERRQHEVTNNQRDAAADIAETADGVAGVSDTLADVSSDVAELDDSVGSVAERLDDVSNEQRDAAADIAAVSDSVTDVSNDVDALDGDVKSVADRLDGVEQRQEEVSTKLDRLLERVEAIDATDSTDAENAANGEEQ
jgi:archaellum component FlaC